MRRNETLDLLKCISCICVVLIHAPFPGRIGGLVTQLIRYCLPVFTLISGYYAYDCDFSKIKKRMLRMLKLTVFASVVYILFCLIYFSSRHELREFLAEAFSVKGIIELFVLNKVRFGFHLWYLFAMIDTYLFWMLVLKLHKEHWMYKIEFILMLINVIYFMVLESFNVLRDFKQFFLNSTLPWFILGYMIKEKEDHIKNISERWIWLLLTLSIIFILTTTVIAIPIKLMYIGISLMAVSIFILGIKNTQAKVPRVPVYIGQRLSLFAYIVHLMVILTIKGVFSKIGIDDIPLIRWSIPVLSVLGTIILALGCEGVFRNKYLSKLIR